MARARANAFYSTPLWIARLSKPFLELRCEVLRVFSVRRNNHLRSRPEAGTLGVRGDSGSRFPGLTPGRSIPLDLPGPIGLNGAE